MRKATTILLLAATVVGGFTLVSLWAVQRLALEVQELLRAARVHAETRMALWPKPRLILANLRSEAPSESPPFSAQAAQAEIVPNVASSLTQRSLRARAVVRDVRVHFPAHEAGVPESVGSLVATLLGSSVAAQTTPAVPSWLAELSLQGVEVTAASSGSDDRSLLHLRKADLLLPNSAAMLVHAVGTVPASGRPFDLQFRRDVLPGGNERRLLKGFLALGEDTLLELDPVEWTVDQAGTLLSASGGGRLAGGQWAVALQHRQGGNEASHVWAIRLERALLKPLVDDFWRDWRGLATGTMQAVVTVRLSTTPPSTAALPLPDLRELHVEGEGTVIDLRVGQWNLGYGLMLALFRSLHPNAPVLPDGLRAAFPSLLVEARTKARELRWRVEQHAGNWQFRNVELRAEGFSVIGEGTWNMADNAVDARFDFLLDGALARAFCQHVPALAACTALERSDAPSARFPFVWRGTFGEALPQPAPL